MSSKFCGSPAPRSTKLCHKKIITSCQHALLFFKLSPFSFVALIYLKVADTLSLIFSTGEKNRFANEQHMYLPPIAWGKQKQSEYVYKQKLHQFNLSKISTNTSYSAQGQILFRDLLCPQPKIRIYPPFSFQAPTCASNCE